MAGKPSREELERRIKDLEDKVVKLSRASWEQQESEQEKAVILDSLVEHVIYEDKEMKILWANRAASESAGLVYEQLIGRHCYEVWPQRMRILGRELALAEASLAHRLLMESRAYGKIVLIP